MNVRTLGIAGLAIVFMAAAAAAGADADRAAIGTADEELAAAIEGRNLETIMALYADHFQSSAVGGKAQQAERYANMISLYDTIKVTRVLKSVVVRAPYAQAASDERLTARATKRTEGIAISRRLLTTYEKIRGRWMVVGEEDIDIAAEAGIKGNTYTNELQGLSLKTPPSWRLHVVRTPLTSIILVTSPDLKSTLNIGRVGLPAGTTVKDAMASDLEAAASIHKRVKTVKAEESVEIAGHIGRRTVMDITVGDRTARVGRTYAANGPSLIFAVLNAESEKAYQAVEQTAREILGTLKIAERKNDPALGTLDDRVYENNKVGCRLELPEGWDASIQKGRGHFKLTLSGDGSAVRGTFVCLDAGKTSIELLVMNDEHNTSRIAPGYELLEDDHVRCATTRGYGTLSTFRVKKESRARKRAYFKTEKYLFCLVLDITPAPFYKKHALAIENMIKGISLPK